MATKFLEPGGDATFTTGLWSVFNGAPAIVTDFVHGGHIKSIQYTANSTDILQTATGTFAQAGSRVSLYVYLTALPAATAGIFGITTSGAGTVMVPKITTAGVLQLFSQLGQIGSNGPTLSLNTWYRISLAYTISSTTVNRFELFVDGVSKISVTNATIGNIAASKILVGNFNGDTTLDFRSSDHYVDDSTALTDPGNIWVTAKRPNANGTANNFTTRIGVAGGSGYGTGHSPQVNERPNDDTNGWSVVGAGSAVTEEYNIEAKGTGDIDISTATIVDYVGWVRASSVTNETASIIVNNVSSNISLTNTNTFFTKVAGSSTYPAGTGTDIGVITDTTVTTVGLYEAGIIVAYIPTTLGWNIALK